MCSATLALSSEEDAGLAEAPPSRGPPPESCPPPWLGLELAFTLGLSYQRWCGTASFVISIVRTCKVLNAITGLTPHTAAAARFDAPTISPSASRVQTRSARSTQRCPRSMRRLPANERSLPDGSRTMCCNKHSQLIILIYLHFFIKILYVFWTIVKCEALHNVIQI